MSALKTTEEFVVLKVKYKTQSSVLRQLFVKENQLKESNDLKPNGKTLFVANIPPFVDRLCVEHLFSSCGKIVDIFFHSKPTSSVPKAKKSKYFDTNEEIFGYKVCYVVFATPSGVQKALNLSKSSEVLSLRPDSDQHFVGLKAMKVRYNESIIDSNELQTEINEFMAEYDKQVEEERVKAKTMDGIPDSEGWIKVSRHSKRKHLPNNLSNDHKIVDKHSKRRKKSSNNMKNFYSFQAKDSKLEYLMALKARFEEDRKKIAIMKAQRKFKPF